MATWPRIAFEVEKDYSHCFGCGQNNPIGLKLRFQWDGTTAKADFTPTEVYQGWPGLVHGGILICMLDEAMGWVALFEGLSTVTAKMQTNLKRPVPINEPLVISGSITKKSRKIVEAKAQIILRDGTVIAEGTAKQFVVNLNGHVRSQSVD